jgi:hypothetical protein
MKENYTDFQHEIQIQNIFDVDKHLLSWRNVSHLK